jgi:acetyl-CoA acetyltransferase
MSGGRVQSACRSVILTEYRVVTRTACSSSLTALHDACIAVQRGECESAIAGGTNLIMNPHMTIAMTEQVGLPNGSASLPILFRGHSDMELTYMLSEIRESFP